MLLLATAGMRLLPSTQAEPLLRHTSSFLAGSGFLHQASWARVISGSLEGVFAWVAANYAAGRLQVAPHATCIRPQPHLVMAAVACTISHWILPPNPTPGPVLPRRVPHGPDPPRQQGMIHLWGHLLRITPASGWLRL